MYKRPHHQKIAQVLSMMNAELLHKTKCYFGGGTAISLLLNEYRESVIFTRIYVAANTRQAMAIVVIPWQSPKALPINI